MKLFIKIFTVTILLFFSINAHACITQIEEPIYAISTTDGVTNGAILGTFIIDNKTSIIGVETTVAKRAEMHEMSHENGVMKMREVKEIKPSSEGIVKFTHDGYHIMLMGLNAPLKAGTNIPLTFTLKNGKHMDIMVPIKDSVRVKGK